MGSDEAMTNSRALITRFALPLAATALVLTACGSSTASDEAAPAAATSAAAEVMESKESEPMESKESEAMESEGVRRHGVGFRGATPPRRRPAPTSRSPSTRAARTCTPTGDVVLFFAADWCPTCQEATKNLEADPAAIPAGLAIVRVDYDNSDELKQKYGVTVQHTFVQVDPEGNEVAKWSGSVTADEIAEQTA